MGATNQGQGDLRHWLRVFSRRKRVFFAILVVLPALVFVGSLLLPKTYQTSALVRVTETTVDAALFTSQVSVTQGSVQTTITLAKTDQVGEEAAKQLGDPDITAGTILSSVQLAPLNAPDGTPTDFVRITAQGEDPESVADMTNAFIAALNDVRTADVTSDIDDAITNLEIQAGEAEVQDSPTDRKAVSSQLAALRGLRASQGDVVSVVQPGTVPTAPVAPQPIRNALLALVVAALLGIAAISIAERIDRRMRDPEELEELVDAPLLATIPTTAFVGQIPGPEVREAFQTLRAGLTCFNVDQALSTVLVASPGPGEGKTTVATYLSIALAQDQRDVILVDGDLRKAQAGLRLGGTPTWGVESVLLDQVGLDEALVDLNVDGGRLRLLPALGDQPNPSVLLGSQSMKSILAELERRSHIVIIDTPALLAVSDALPLLSLASGSMLVSRLEFTRRDAFEKTAQIISSSGGNLLGTVATGAIGGYLYGYGYGYGGYGYGNGLPGDGAAEPTNGVPGQATGVPA